jgi:hypothetical protein
MNDGRPPTDDRLFDLLADRATQGLSPAEAAELGRLLAAAPGEDAGAYDRAAAVLDRVFAGPLPGLPQHLCAALERDARLAIAPSPQPRSPFGRRLTAWAGWAAAAACLAAAVWAWRPAPVLTPAERRAALLAASPFTPRLKVVPKAAAAAEGDVVWGMCDQEGFLRVTGLPPNDPAVGQYQAWIYDRGRAGPPVDGGVFDVRAGGEVVVPIRAKLLVGEPREFAVTFERPGGVVVSELKADQLMLIAKADL